MNPGPLSALVMMAVVSCSEPPVERDLTRVRDSAGIQIMTNLGPATDTVTLDSTAVRIGGVDVADEYAFQRLTDVAVLADGSVVVADMVGRVAQFDSTGRWVRDFGGSGSGPGEFRQPWFIEVVGDTVVVWDARSRRLSLFTVDGEFLDVAPVRKRDSRLAMHWSSAVWFDEQEWGQAANTVAARAIVVRMRGNEIVDTVKGPYPIPEIQSERSGDRVALLMPPAFSVRPQWNLCAEGLIWTDTQQPRIEQFGMAGELLRVIELARPVRRIDASDREAYVSAMAARWDLGAEVVDEMRRDGRFAATAPSIVGLVCGVDGTVWASHFDPSVPQSNDAVGPVWDVIDASGRVNTQVRFPPGFVLKTVARGKAYGIALRELDVNVVEIYELPPAR